MRKADNKGVVIKREEVVEGEPHGGAWKVAYADFVTAMMAFFLLMWLLNATTEDQRKGLADYFSPNSVLSHASSGTGDPFGGHTAFDSGALVSDRGAVQVIVGNHPAATEATSAASHPVAPESGEEDDGRGPRPGQTDSGAGPAAAAAPAGAPGSGSATASGRGAAEIQHAVSGQGREPANAAAAGSGKQAEARGPAAASGTAPASVRPPMEAELKQATAQHLEAAAFATAAQAIRDAVRGDPALAELAKQLAIEMTPEGLRIQILDEENRSMFALGSAAPNNRVRLLLQKVTPILVKLPQEIAIAGYTDATPFSGPDRTNWELSTERANAARRLMVDDGLPEGRIRNVAGHADRDPLLPGTPFAAANRRIAIVVLHDTGGQADRPAAPNATP